MDSIIKKLYSGMIYPAEQVVPRDPEYTNAIRRQYELTNQLEARLKSEDYQLVEELCDWDAVAQDKQSLEFFRKGLSLGLGLMREAQECLNPAGN